MSRPGIWRVARGRRRLFPSADRQNDAETAGGDLDAADRPSRFANAPCFSRFAAGRIRLQGARAHVRIVRRFVPPPVRAAYTETAAYEEFVVLELRVSVPPC